LINSATDRNGHTAPTRNEERHAMSKKFWGFLACAAVLACAPLSALADSWPSRPVRVIEPGTPGSSPDRMTRLIAERLAKQWGQPVLVENRPGASTRIGTELVARAAPDGYTLLSTFGTHSMVRLLYPDTSYDPIKDFAPIIEYARPEVVMVVRADSPYKSLKDLVADLKASNKPLRYAHFGNGSSFHFYGLIVGREFGFDVLPVPYKGEAPQMTDLLGGHIEASFNSVGTALPHIQAGKARALGLVGPSRSKVLPDVPTFAELGFKEGMNNGGWFGFLAPAGTPQAVIDKVAADIRTIMQDPEVAKIMREQGMEPVSAGPREFAEVIAQEVTQWAKLIKEFNVKAD
jgi:tripartite-type tricarboxylate transporter receptor subunit TctC